MSGEFYCGCCGKWKPTVALREVRTGNRKRCAACVELGTKNKAREARQPERATRQYPASTLGYFAKL